jgi:hypothetical protein
MALIILLPAVLCWVVLAKGSARSALINVYLPSVLLLPQYFELRFPHLPPLTFADTAIVPLGIALCVTEMRRWRLDWMDLLVVLFALSSALSEGLSTVLAEGTWPRIFTSPAETLPGNVNNGIFQFITGILRVILPYMVGKLLIEGGEYEGQPARKVFLRRMVIMLAFVAAVSVVDFLTGRSTWQTAFRHFFPDQPTLWPTQVRWGFGRVTGAYAHAILAGMVFLMGLTYCVWLRSFAPEWGGRKIIKGLPLTFRGLVLWATIGGLLMTQSRGPWLGVMLAMVFVFLMRTFTVVKATVIFLVLAAAFSTVGYFVGNAYTKAAGPIQGLSEEQQSAIYRRDLIRNYLPAVKIRKLFGWGITTYPEIAGQKSIDNEFLMLAVTQGLVGLGLFLLIVAGSAGRLLWLAARPMLAEDQGLIFAHLAVMIGMMTALATVYLGEQAFLLFFLIVGWVHGINPARVSLQGRVAVAPAFGFRRVLT